MTDGKPEPHDPRASTLHRCAKRTSTRGALSRRWHRTDVWLETPEGRPRRQLGGDAPDDAQPTFVQALLGTCSHRRLPRIRIACPPNVFGFSRAANRRLLEEIVGHPGYGATSLSSLCRTAVVLSDGTLQRSSAPRALQSRLFA